jgi:hypothetical protein
MGKRLNNIGRWVLRAIAAAGAVVAVCASGCEKSSQSPSVSSGNPTTNPSSPATQPAYSFLMIDGKLEQFPPALLRLQAKGGQVTALLCTDDPPEALNDSYQGNSFYLPMVLDIADPADIGTAQWKCSAGNDHIDSPEGIFLHGAKLQLQPFKDVEVDFAGSEPKVTVSVNGQFLAASTVRGGPESLPKFSQVSGTFPSQATEPK